MVTTCYDMKSPEFCKISHGFRQNNKLYMVTPCHDMKSPELCKISMVTPFYDMKSPVFCKISHLSAKITSYIWWLHAMTGDHQRALQNFYGNSMLWHEITSFLQNFNSFRQNNKLYMVTPCYDMKSPAKITSYGDFMSWHEITRLFWLLAAPSSWW